MLCEGDNEVYASVGGPLGQPCSAFNPLACSDVLADGSLFLITADIVSIPLQPPECADGLGGRSALLCRKIGNGMTVLSLL